MHSERTVCTYIFYSEIKMTLREASKYYDIDFDRLALYEKYGLIAGTKISDGTDYPDSELQKVSLIDLLREANMNLEEIRFYLAKTTVSADMTKKISLLRRQRSKVLDDIHDKQKLLQNLDYLIYENEKTKKKE